MPGYSIREWKWEYMTNFQGRPFDYKCMQHIRRGFFDLPSSSIDEMLETIDAGHLRKYMAVI